ncbi:MAG: cytochrome c biogenesis protein CcsA [Sedimentisphaerales bacterium]|nr:cytochrome c biogenesis protein CcsA [Sedimentisphaerales bacterium]
MLDLSAPEAILFVVVATAHVAGGTIALMQLVRPRGKWQRFLTAAVTAAVLADAIFLGVRAAQIRAVPLTGLFESLVALALVFGVLYLLLRLVVQQVWFGSVLAWTTLGMVLLAGLVAKPASKPQAVAATPWAVAHASVMILAAAAVVFATANSALYLLTSHRLKQKEILRVLGRMPNMETLGRMNRISLGVGFALLTVGVLTGLGLVSSLGTGVREWLVDGKVLCIMAVWLLLGGILILDRLSLLKEKARAYVTIVAFVLVILAVLGVTVAGVTQHKFSACTGLVAPTEVA